MVARSSSTASNGSARTFSPRPRPPPSSLGTLRADANLLNALGEREAADVVLARLEELSVREPSVSDVRLPYALKGMRRALLKRDPARAR